MYSFQSMVDMALPEGLKWPTEKHRQLAIRLLIANPRIIKLEDLQKGVIHITQISSQQLSQIKLKDVINFHELYLTQIKI